MTVEEVTRFQKLHRQSVVGEELSESDRAFYDATLRRLNTEESAQLRTYQDGLSSRIDALEEELSRLQEHRAVLKARLESQKAAHAA